MTDRWVLFVGSELLNYIVHSELTCSSVFSMTAEEERQAANNRNSFLANDASQTHTVTRHLHAVETRTVDTLYKSYK